MMRTPIAALTFLIAASAFALSPACVTITSVTPSTGIAGTQVVITGSGFAICCPFECPQASVTFDGVQAQVVSWSDTKLVVIAPPHAPGSSSVTVSQISASASAANAFTFLAGVPALGAVTAALAAAALIALALIRLR